VTTDSHPLSLHDALPISSRRTIAAAGPPQRAAECAPSLHLTTRQPLVYTPTRWRGCSCENVGSLPRTGSLRSSYGSCRDGWPARSEEHTSELQSPYDLVC